MSGYLIKLLNSYLYDKVVLITTNPLEIFLAMVKLSLFLSMIIILPILIYQIVGFVKPALNENEKKVLRFIPLGLTLFFSGFILSFVLMLKIGIEVLADVGTSLGILNLWSLSETISFIFMLSFVVGICFQLPIVLVMLDKLKIIKYDTMMKRRKFFYVLMFIISAIITPTVDPVTQTIVAIPLVLLYELSLFLMKIID